MTTPRLAVALILTLVMPALTLGSARVARAQGSSPTTLNLYINPSTKVVYSEPGPGRRLLSSIPISPANADLVRETQAQLQQNQSQIRELETQNSQLAASNRQLTQQMAQIRPAWRSYIDNFQNKFRLGTLVYGDYRFYTHTGFQPQELTQINNLGPGNNDWNTFDISRAYLNFFFFPASGWTMRVTPNIYRTFGSSNDKEGQSTGFGSTLDGNYGYRLKYAMLQYSSLWDRVPMLKGGTVSIGQIPNPLVGWEEDLYGFRYVNLTPWNYYSLSSTQLGLSIEGQVKPYGGETSYFDYGLGVYNNASFHAFESTNTKQVMVRGTYYPFGAKWRFQGLGLTGFYNYGYGNTAPDTADLPAALKGPDSHITRLAALLHYAAEQWGVATEFDYGNNAFSASNLFSGSGPADAFGFATGPSEKASVPWNTTCSATKPCYSIFDTYGPQTAAYEAILNDGQARQISFDMFGHFHIPRTRMTLFGMYQWMQPNDKFADDPLDFERFVVGISYQVNEFLRFALDSQNTMFYHSQESRPISYLSEFGYVPGSTFNGLALPETGSIPFLVPRDTHSIFANMEFNY